MALCQVVIGANTFTDDRILSVSHPESVDSQAADIVLDNSDKALNPETLPLKGLKAVISYENTAGGGYTARPPLWVIDQQLGSWHKGLVCTLICRGKSNLIAEDHASSDYKHDATSTKTVKTMLTEIMNGTAVAEELTVSQLLADATISLYGASKVLAGQKIFLNERTVTSLSFKLSKVGSPTGNVVFRIRSSFIEGTIYQSATWGNASSLTTTPTMYELVWAAPIEITDIVYMYVDYSGGDASNYVNVSYKDAAVKSGECLMDFINSYVEYPLKDCTYQYQYNATGIGVFSHCTAHVIDWTENYGSIIDVYCPKDGFSIGEGETRDSVAKRLLQFTDCVMRVEADENFHVFVPTTTGTSYDEEWSDAQFFYKSKLDGLVIPNFITVHSYPNDADQYTGTANDATSYALLPIRDSRQMTLAADQAASIAAAIIAQLQVSKGKGSALVPLNKTAQAYDYIKVTDTGEDDTLIGNISQVTRIFKSNKYGREKPQLSMQVMVGGIANAPILAYKKRAMTTYTADEIMELFAEPHPDDEPVTWGSLKEVVTKIYGHLNDSLDLIDSLYYGLSLAGVDLVNLKNETEDRGGINDLIIAQLTTYATRGYVDGVVRIMAIKPIAYNAALTAGDGLDIVTIPVYFNSWVLCSVEASVDTASTSGAITIQIRNVTDTVDMLSTAITIDQDERNSATAAAPAVINLTYDDVATGDRIAIDIDGAGTGAKGLEIKLGFRKEAS